MEATTPWTERGWYATSKGREFVNSPRRELETLNAEIPGHPHLRGAEQGALPREKIERFVVNQLYIIPHDLRSLSHLLSRVSEVNEMAFFRAAVDADYAAASELLKLARELGIGSGRRWKPTLKP